MLRLPSTLLVVRPRIVLYRLSDWAGATGKEAGRYRQPIKSLQPELSAPLGFLYPARFGRSLPVTPRPPSSLPDSARCAHHLLWKLQVPIQVPAVRIPRVRQNRKLLRPLPLLHNPPKSSKGHGLSRAINHSSPTRL